MKRKKIWIDEDTGMTMLEKMLRKVYELATKDKPEKWAVEFIADRTDIGQAMGDCAMAKRWCCGNPNREEGSSPDPGSGRDALAYQAQHIPI